MAGSDQGSAEQKPASATVWMEKLTKFAAVLGAFVALGQTGSEAIRGYWQREADLAKAEQDLKLTQAKATQELELTRLKESSKLAQDYIQMLMNKDVSAPDRIMLLGALGQIKDHPLQTWAQKRYDAITKNLDAINRARDEQIKAYSEKDEKEREAHLIEAKIAEANEQAKLKSEDVAASGQFKEEVRKLSERLATLKGEIGVVVAKVDTRVTVTTRTDSGDTVPVTEVKSKAGEITSLMAKIDTKLMLTVFPPSAASNIDKYLPFVKAAMQEFQVSDKRIAAAILATIYIETGNFTPATQLGSDSQYRGRGFILMTGERNYTKMSARLGLGTRLVDSPEEANSPEVAARVLCAFFVDAEQRLQRAFERGDIAALYGIVAGSGGAAAKRFADTYQKLIVQL
jgi:predicted chitinase